MLGDSQLAINLCMRHRLLKVLQYTRSDGRHCAEITAVDPITRDKHNQTIAVKEEAKFAQKLATAKRAKYRDIRNNFLYWWFMTEPLTLKKYLELDCPALKEQWPASYDRKEFIALEQFANAMDCDLRECHDADLYIGLLATLGLKRDLEMRVLRMLTDIIDELIRLGLFVRENPIADYYHAAKSNDNRKKAANRHSTSIALSDCALRAIAAEYREKRMTDARYLAVPLRTLGLSTAQIAAFNIGDLNDQNGRYALPVRNQMILLQKRFLRAAVSNEWESRLLPMDWLRDDIQYWIEQYARMGVSDVKKAPLCAYGCRRHPKRCTPPEIEEFLQALLSRHTSQMSELRPTKRGTNPAFRDVSRKITSIALPESFQVAGRSVLDENPFLARYLLGQPAETVDERVYLDFTSARIQAKINDLISQIFGEMKGDYNNNDECGVE